MSHRPAGILSSQSTANFPKWHHCSNAPANNPQPVRAPSQPAHASALHATVSCERFARALSLRRLRWVSLPEGRGGHRGLWPL